MTIISLEIGVLRRNGIIFRGVFPSKDNIFDFISALVELRSFFPFNLPSLQNAGLFLMES